MKNILPSLIAALLAIAPGAHGEGPATAGKSFAPLDEAKSFVGGADKDAADWSFTIEPYLWAMGMAGNIGVKGLPPSHVDYSSRTIFQHLDWGVMSKAEIRKGRWGLLGDGLFAQLSANASEPGPLYDGTSIKVQQGMASLALAFRVIDDRRGFLDIYAGARYNYFGIEINSSTDTSGINQVATQVTDRISTGVDSRVDSTVATAEEKLRTDLTVARAELRSAESARIEEIESEIATAEAERLAQIREDLAPTLKRDLEKKLRSDLFYRSLRDRDGLSKGEVHRVARGVRSELRSYVNAVVEARVSAFEARLATDKGRADARLEADKSRAESRVAAAQKKLAKAIASEIEDTLPTSFEGSQWWVDPIVGLRAQLNVTRWLFLAAQSDVGGFGAGSNIAWNVQASLGVNFTRNVFGEVGYRYFYMDYQNGGALYDAAEVGIFSGIGVKF